LLIADVRLPGISGLELIERARVRNPGLRLVLITGMTDEKVRRQVELARADAFFYKPISIDDFLNTAQELLVLGAAGEALPKAPLPAPQRPESRLAPLQPGDTRPASPVRPPEPAISRQTPKTPLQNVQERTAALRKHLNASLAVVLALPGETIAADGLQPGESPEWVQVLEAAAGFAASAAARQRGLIFVPGAVHDFLIAPVTEQVLLLVGGRRSVWQDIPFGRMTDAVWTAAGDLRAAGVASLAPAASSAQAAAPSPAANPTPGLFGALEEEQSLPDLSLLFDPTRAQSLNETDVDAFWDMAAEDHSTRQSRPGAISFDQARQLGLAPDED
jgi:CheY-like chemotaxis protein